MKGIFTILNIKINNFILVELSIVNYLLKDNNEMAMIIDCGHLSTSVVFANNNHLEALNEFSLGGGIITSDLMSMLKLGYNTCNELKRKVVLSYTPDENDIYNIIIDDEIKAVSSMKTNKCIIDGIICIAKMIKVCLDKNSNYKIPELKVYLCGGGLSYIKGAREILAKELGYEIEVLSPNLPILSKPHFVSMISLLNETLK